MIEIVHGIVLRAVDSGEFDRRVTLYTKERGKIAAKVSGVRKSRSKLRVLTIPYAESRLQIYLAGSHRAGVKTPGKIISGEITCFHAPLRNDFERMIQCATFCEILDQITHPFSPHPGEYEFLTTSLSQMENSSSPLLVRLCATLVLLRILGYSLRHHPTWQNYSEKERMLLNELGKWDSIEEKFSADEIKQMEILVSSYLCLYLSYPLKTDLFQQKIRDYLKISMASPKL